MNPQFNIGDEVVCRLGGPKMLVNSVLHVPADLLGQQQIPGQVATYQYGCIYWNHISNLFNSAVFKEALLEDAPKNQP